MKRRTLLQTLLAGGAAAALNACRTEAQPDAATSSQVKALQADWRVVPARRRERARARRCAEAH